MSRHLTREELIDHHKKLGRVRNNLFPESFSIMAIIWNYVLYNDYKFRLSRLQQFNEGLLKYLEPYNTENFIELRERLLRRADFILECGDSEKTYNKKYTNRIHLEKKEIQEKTNKYSTFYNLCAFNYMIDKGYGKKRLERLKNSIKTLMYKAENNELNLIKCHQELAYNGVIIELPNI